MAFEKRNTRHYAKQLAKKYDLPLHVVNSLLSYFTRNIVQAMLRKNDIRLPGFGRLWLEKPYSKKKRTLKQAGSKKIIIK